MKLFNQEVDAEDFLKEFETYYKHSDGMSGFYTSDGTYFSTDVGYVDDFVLPFFSWYMHKKYNLNGYVIINDDVSACEDSHDIHVFAKNEEEAIEKAILKYPSFKGHVSRVFYYKNGFDGDWDCHYYK